MGLLFKPEYLNRSEQIDLVAEIHRVLLVAPPFTPKMPRTGKPFSVRMTNCGPLGWVSDIAGYRYQKFHPETGQPWPPIPKIVLRVWQELSEYPHPPEACLVNIYTPAAKDGASPGSRRGSFRRACPFALARRYLRIQDWREEP